MCNRFLSLCKKSVELDKYIICLMVGKFHRAYVHISNWNIQTTPKSVWQGEKGRGGKFGEIKDQEEVVRLKMENSGG